jgi:hypothetical protein
MKAVDLNTRLIDSYYALLKNLNPKSKLDLISKLTQSIKSDMGKDKSTFENSFGAWDKKDNAEKLTESIRASRTFNRNIEEL